MTTKLQVKSHVQHLQMLDWGRWKEVSQNFHLLKEFRRNFAAVCNYIDRKGSTRAAILLSKYKAETITLCAVHKCTLHARLRSTAHDLCRDALRSARANATQVLLM